MLQQLKLCSTNSPPVRRADEGSDDDIDDKVDVDDDALTEAVAGDSIDVDDNDDDDNDDDKDNDNNDDNDNDEFEVLVDVKKLNTKMSAANKRALFAKVMSEQHTKYSIAMCSQARGQYAQTGIQEEISKKGMVWRKTKIDVDV